VNSSAILEVRQLTKSYPNGGGSLTVVRDISFTIEADSSCAIVGPSAAATTLLGL
jgi:putative ABC transport system ATP-binding protein